MLKSHFLGGSALNTAGWIPFQLIVPRRLLCCLPSSHRFCLFIYVNLQKSPKVFVYSICLMIWHFCKSMNLSLFTLCSLFTWLIRLCLLLLHGHGDGNHVVAQVDVETISQGFKDPLDDQDGRVFVWVDEDVGNFLWKFMWNFFLELFAIPYAPCMEYFPTFALKINQM